jgi:hypothetical protein
MQIKTTWLLLIPVRMVIIKKTNAGKGAGGKGPLYTRWERSLAQPLWKSVWKILKQLKPESPYDPATPLLGIFLKGCKSAHSKSGPLHTHVYCSRIHNSQAMDSPRCPWMDEWTKTMWYIHTIEYYSAIKKNETMPFARKWMELENFILNKISQSQRQMWCVFSHLRTMTWK